MDKKACTDPIVFKSKYIEIKNTYYNFERIYTDGSKDGKRAAVAVPDGDVITFRLPDNSSIFSAELKAIDLALDLIKSEGYWRYIIFTNSLSAMQALQNEKIKNPLVVNLLSKLSYICATSNVVFCWIPSHMGIRGNEQADLAAKSALSKISCL